MSTTPSRIGPMDPDASERFNAVSAVVSAKDLIRNHQASYLPKTLAALSLKRNDARTDFGALDLDEVIDVLTSGKNGLDSDAVLQGAAVRGEEGIGKKYVSFTWNVPVEAGGSGRIAKGALEYTAETFPRSFKLGNDAVAAAQTQSATGAPVWVRELLEGIVATQGKQAEPVAPPEPQVVPDPKDAERIKELEKQLAAAKSASNLKAPPVPQNTADTAGGPLPEPFDGYLSLDVDQVKARLKTGDLALAESVLKFEGSPAGKNRAGVIGAANEKIGKSAPSGS